MRRDKREGSKLKTIILNNLNIDDKNENNEFGKCNGVGCEEELINPTIKDLRSALKRATFMKKISSKRPNTSPCDDDCDGKNCRKCVKSFPSGKSSAFQKKAQFPKEDEIILDEKELRIFSKLLDLDCPKEFKIYYPKNNVTNVVN